MGIIGKVRKKQVKDVAGVQQQRLDFDGIERVPDSADVGMDGYTVGTELSALHRQTEEILKKRNGDRYPEHLAAAMARYIDWRAARAADRKTKRGRAIARKQAKRERGKPDVHGDDCVVDVSTGERPGWIFPYGREPECKDVATQIHDAPDID